MEINSNKLALDFYQGTEVTDLAAQLLGKRLFTRVNGEITGGIIVETEAYNGVTDKASHAYGGRLTNRTKVMYEAGGLAYVYLCYGIHYLFNIVTGPKHVPHAVLIRGIEPIEGLDVMLRRRAMPALKSNLTAGPGALAKALGINKTLNGKSLQGSDIWIEEGELVADTQQIVSGPRIGVAYAQEDALLPWRYYIKGNKFVSKPNR